MKRFSIKVIPAFILLLIISNCGAQNIDVKLLKKFNSRETKFKDKYLGANSSFITPVTVAVPASLLIGGVITGNKQLTKDAIYVTGSYLLSGAVTTILKKSIARKRPCDQYQDIVIRQTTHGGGSFPSGHTSAAFNLATSLSLRYHKWYVIAPSYLYAASVGWARMYQGVHYPSDVLVGAIVGCGTAWVGYKVQNKWSKVNTSKRRLI